ncbi:thioredoxin [Bdellovibrio sp. 22V]|uniref:thioredoxin n=1 Tax=Bdellovibrio TaxID=958 RepID=UPI002543C977|nr:thioredoxin [Bdellovibrio sp. 22V]WII70576.1 thioredoxin [Bdellovibrio sp. 22V]
MAVMEMTKENIKDTVEKNQLVIIDFWAEWCGPCKRFAPIFDAVANKHSDVVFAKVDTEAQQELAANFEIMSIPTLMVIKEGHIIFAQPGALPEDVLEEIVTKAKEVDMEQVRRENPE